MAFQRSLTYIYPGLIRTRVFRGECDVDYATHYIYFVAVKYTKWSQTWKIFFITRFSKIYPNWYFGCANMPSGNPEPRYDMCNQLWHRDATDHFMIGLWLYNQCDLGSMLWSQFFCCFCQFLAKKLAFFSNPNVMIKIFSNLALLGVKNAIFSQFFRRKYFTSVPD
jgi:hypothetical protein